MWFERLYRKYTTIASELGELSSSIYHLLSSRRLTVSLPETDLLLASHDWAVYSIERWPIHLVKSSEDRIVLRYQGHWTRQYSG